MAGNAFLQFVVFSILCLGLGLGLARYMARLFAEGEKEPPFSGFLPQAERVWAKIGGPRYGVEQNWREYLFSVLGFNFVGFAFLFLIVKFQGSLPENPLGFKGLSTPEAFNTAVSFMTNTDWQAYAGETTLSFFSQMVGLTAQGYLSAATGISVAFAFVRGFARKEKTTIGNFYSDVTHVTLYVLIPLGLLFALFLIQQGVPQNMVGAVQATTLEGAQQTIAQGPVASQMAIKMLGSNGGGFFGVSSAHPYENPTPLTNFVQIVSILLLPLALVFAFGRMVGDKRQSRALFASMSILFVFSVLLIFWFENTPHPGFASLAVDQIPSATNIGGNMEGKETRFGLFGSLLWTTTATATSHGSLNSMLDSYMPLGGLVPLFNILVGEVIYGGVGCGLHGILVYVLITVFIAGLMVGRTPEYLGKKIEAHEIKLAVIALLLYPVCVLGFGVISLLATAGEINGAHGLTQTIYAYASTTANNGSAFAGFAGDTTFQNILLAVAMLMGRFGIIIPVLAISGALAAKKTIPPSSGTFPTHGGMFVVFLTAVILLFGGLTYFPALVLGPIAEHLSLFVH